MKFITIFLINFYFIKATDPPYGQLKIKGTYVTNSAETPVQLIGMSLFHSEDKIAIRYWSEEALSLIKTEWNANIVRAPMDIEGFYLNNPEVEYEKVKRVIEAAINLGIYVIVDWHEERADQHIPQASQFFKNISQTYGSYPHIIYEIWNEPNHAVNWTTIKFYAEQIIPVIRANDKNNIIVVGTEVFSKGVDIASKDPLNFTNVAYTLHYYAAAHKQELRDRATTAINNGACLFITEYGTVNYTGLGAVDYNSSQEWWNFNDQNKLSYVNWALANNDPDYNVGPPPNNQGASAFIKNTTVSQVGNSTFWTPSGKFVNQKYRTSDQGVNAPCVDISNDCAQYLNYCGNPSYFNLLCNKCRKTCKICGSCD